MASITQTIRLRDQMTKTLNKNINAVRSLRKEVSSFKSAGAKFDTGNLVSSKNAAFDRITAANQRMKQKITESTNAQDKFTNASKRSALAQNGIMSSVSRIAGVIATYAGISKLTSTSDDMAGANARLGLINDGLMTQKQLQDEVYNSAMRSRTSYLESAQAVAKLGLMTRGVFKDNKQIVAFTELMNKQFAVGGASAEEQMAARLQLTQAMSSGKLQGDEYRSIRENAPLLANSIEDYMHNVVKAKGSMKDWAAEGKLTADVIKNAMFMSANETEKRFKKLPVTFAQVKTLIGNVFNKAMTPMYSKMSEIFSNKSFQKDLESLAVVVGSAMSKLAGSIEYVVRGLKLIADNWQGIVSVMAIVAGAYAIYSAAMIADNIAMIATNPVFWIIAGLALLIGIIVAVIANVEQAKNSTLSSFAAIMGGIFAVGATIYNIVAAVVNFVINVINSVFRLAAILVDFFIDMWNNPAAAAQNFFINILQWAVDAFGTIAKLIDDIFGTNMQKSINSAASYLQSMKSEKSSRRSEQNLIDWQMTRASVGKSIANGQGFGTSLETSFNKFKNSNAGALDSPSSNSPANKTAKNTKKIADAVTSSEQDIALLRDIAVRGAINRFAASTININMKNNNQISKEADVDGVVNEIANRLEGVFAGANGVHA